MSRMHIAQSGKNKGLFVPCPAQKQCRIGGIHVSVERGKELNLEIEKQIGERLAARQEAHNQHLLEQLQTIEKGEQAKKEIYSKFFTEDGKPVIDVTVSEDLLREAASYVKPQPAPAAFDVFFELMEKPLENYRKNGATLSDDQRLQYPPKGDDWDRYRNMYHIYEGNLEHYREQFTNARGYENGFELAEDTSALLRKLDKETEEGKYGIHDDDIQKIANFAASKTHTYESSVNMMQIFDILEDRNFHTVGVYLGYQYNKNNEKFTVSV